MNPRIVTIDEKKLVGKRLVMSFSDYKVADLWKSFMPHRREITNSVNGDLFSIAVYSPTFFISFRPETEFEKWATVEVADFDNIPVGMESFTLKAGLYAVFEYKGSNTDHSIFDYIFGRWLPDSEYLLDDRPHFEILGNKYKNNDPASEEEIWIPIKLKQL